MADLVLVASGGGHLEQLKVLADRIGAAGSRRWITFDTPQSRSMLRDEEASFVPYIGPRDYKGLAQNLSRMRLVGTRKSTERIVSTGAGIALAYLPYAAALGIDTHYIESATRVLGPSFTGRVMARTPGISVHTQHKRWSDEKWQYAGSVFDGFEPIQIDHPLTAPRIVVSLGTIRPYGFRRLVERLIPIIGEDAHVIWQTGATDVSGLPIEARPAIDHAELLDEIDKADLLVAHAGAGIALTALRSGKCPLLVPREAAYGEHVDNHQAEVAKLLGDAGLSVSRSVNALCADDLRVAAETSVISGAAAGRPMELVPA